MVEETLRVSDSVSSSYADVDYTIVTRTDDDALQGSASIRIRGDRGIVTIPLSNTVSGQKPFRSNTDDEFICRTNDVGKVKCVTVENHGMDEDKVWHLKSLQIQKGNDTLEYEQRRQRRLIEESF